MPKWNLIGDSVIIAKAVGIVTLIALFIAIMGVREGLLHLRLIKP